MANLPLAFAEAGLGAILLVAGISGSSIGDVIRGAVTMHPLLGGSDATVNVNDVAAVSNGGAAGGFKPVKSNAKDFQSGTAFATALLKAIKAPVTQNNIDNLIAWQAAESPEATATSLTMDAAFNPLNTTLAYGPVGDLGGPTANNGDPVKIYSSPANGLNATAQTLLNTSAFAPIVSVLRNNGSKSDLSTAVVNSRWGTGAFA